MCLEITPENAEGIMLKWYIVLMLIINAWSTLKQSVANIGAYVVAPLNIIIW